ncbi:MAG: hypothetical protein JRJ49_10950 [Deltaproteobacteria bacterium]|nr:hypothetical protein [Deltaproteobacteria bacterium]
MRFLKKLKQEESYEYSFHEKTSFNLRIPSFDLKGGREEIIEEFKNLPENIK